MYHVTFTKSDNNRVVTNKSVSFRQMSDQEFQQQVQARDYSSRIEQGEFDTLPHIISDF